VPSSDSVLLVLNSIPCNANACSCQMTIDRKGQDVTVRTGTRERNDVLGSTGGSGQDHHGLAWRLGRLRPVAMEVALEWEVAHLARDDPR
jgi:hypothetical protein